MRRLCLVAALVRPLAMAQSLSVEPHSLMRLPGKDGVLTLDRLVVEDYATLLVPDNLVELKVGELRLGHEARIAIVPGSEQLRIEARHAELGEGSQTLNVSVINAVGNTATSPLNFTVDNTLPSIALAPIGDDNYLNAQELGGAVVVSGSTSGLPGQHYYRACQRHHSQHQRGGRWKLEPDLTGRHL